MSYHKKKRMDKGKEQATVDFSRWRYAVVKTGPTWQLRAYPVGGSPYQPEQPPQGPLYRVLAQRTNGVGKCPPFMRKAEEELERAVSDTDGLPFEELVEMARRCMLKYGRRPRRDRKKQLL